MRTPFRRALAVIEDDGGVDPDRVAESYRSLSGVDLLRWFDDARACLVEIFRELDPALRVPCFGMAMSAASSVTARIMEAWAHGQDVADALGLHPEPTARLRHVAHIGVGARAYSFEVNGLEMPDVPVRVELASPDGTTWAWGSDDAPDPVSGAAVQFCLAVTQRRHLADLDLVIVGAHAQEWMSIAQAFAGGAGFRSVAEAVPDVRPALAAAVLR